MRAGAAIVTVPIGVLKAGGIRFAPALPAAIADALDGLGMGAYTKIALKLDRERVGALEATDLIEIVDGGAVSFEFWPFGRDLVRRAPRRRPRPQALRGGRARGDRFRHRAPRRDARRPHPRGGHGRAARRLVDRPLRPRQLFGRAPRPRSAPARRCASRSAGASSSPARRRAGGGAMTVGGATLDGERAARAVLDAQSLAHGIAPAPAPQALTLP